MYTLASDSGGVAVNAASDTDFFWNTTFLKRDKSGGFATLTGPLLSAATKPCI
jgi:hypothetical protein